MHVTNFVSKIDKKNVHGEINFTNYKTLGSYIAKLKPEETSLQMTQNP